jgi:uncharacterized membrane protein YphA (DoxX/SURF4 family)
MNPVERTGTTPARRAAATVTPQRLRPPPSRAQAQRPRRRAGHDDQEVLESLYRFAEEWASVAARVLLAVVLAWFGYHELTNPGLWTGYVPILSPTAAASQVLVLAHGWALLVLAVALAAGIAPRLAGAAAAIILLEIVVSLSLEHGLSDLVMRDVGVFGLALAVAGQRGQRLLLRH